MNNQNRLIIVKRKLSKKIYSFSNFIALHHVQGISAFYKANCWIYQFDLSDEKQAKSLFTLKLNNEILLDSETCSVNNFSLLFDLISVHSKATKEKQRLQLEVSKAKALYNYHKIVLEEKNRDILNQLSNEYKKVEQEKKEHSREFYNLPDKRTLEILLSDLRYEISKKVRGK